MFGQARTHGMAHVGWPLVAIMAWGGLACGRTSLGHAPRDAGVRRVSDAQMPGDGRLVDTGNPAKVSDGGRFVADQPAPNCQMVEMQSVPFENLPLDGVAGLRRSPNGFWIFGHTRQEDSQAQAFFGELRPDGFVTHLMLPPGTTPGCHAVSADGRHWLAGTAKGQLSRDATTLASPATLTGFLVELNLADKTVTADPIPGEPDSCVADPQGGVVLAGTGLRDGRQGPDTAMWARYDADHHADWFKGLASEETRIRSAFPGEGTFNRSIVLALGRDGNLVACGKLDDDILLAKLSLTGTFLWHHQLHSQSLSSDHCTGMALDSHDEVWMSGYFRDGIDLGGGVLPDQDKFTPLLGKFTPDGSHLLSFSLPRQLTALGADGSDHLWAVSSLCDGACIAAVERYDPEGNLECRFPMETLQGHPPLALLPDEIGAWVLFIRNPNDPQTTIAHIRFAP